MTTIPRDTQKESVRILFFPVYRLKIISPRAIFFLQIITLPEQNI